MDIHTGGDWEKLTPNEQSQASSASAADRQEFFSEVLLQQEKLLNSEQQDKSFFGMPLFGAFADFDYKYLISPFSWKAQDEDALVTSEIVVPKGFVTDFASVPRMFWSFVPKDGAHTAPAILHDWLYWHQDDIPRDTADRLFLDTMKYMNVKKRYRMVMYKTLQVFGGAAWEANAKAKAGGESRILRKFPDDVSISWDEWKQNAQNFM